MAAMNLRASIQASLRRFAEDEAGATAIEYGMIATLLGLAIVLGVFQLGVDIADLFTYFEGHIGS